MAKFFLQHIGEALSRRDFPKSLGTTGSLRTFMFDELMSLPTFSDSASARDRALLSESDIGWQIWGLPAGARSYTNQMHKGDSLMLLGSEKTCEFVADIFYRFPGQCPEISRAIWGEARFPVIVLLTNSQFINLLWSDFKERVGYAENYRITGATSRVGEGRLTLAGFSDANDLARWVRSFAAPQTLGSK